MEAAWQPSRVPASLISSRHDRFSFAQQNIDLNGCRSRVRVPGNFWRHLNSLGQFTPPGDHAQR
jgi:hypothetical protein